MADSSVLLDIDSQGIARATLNRPQKHNAFNEHVIAELNAAFEQVRNSTKARVMVLAANGKSFSAGADLDWMKRTADYSFGENVADASNLALMLNNLNTLPLPTIARVQGAAYGGGVGLIACCDFVLATPAATFCLSEVKLGLVPGTVSPYVIAAIGSRMARHLFVSAETLDAVSAQNAGLVTQVVDEEELDPRIDAMTEQLMANSPSAMAAAKQLVIEVSDRPIDAQLMQFTSEAIASARTSNEGREGVQAFLQKRLPAWRQA